METNLQTALYQALIADAGLDALLARHEFESPPAPAVYDQAPQVANSEDGSKFPYIVIGDVTAAEFDTDDRNGKEFTVTLHVWDRRGARKKCRQVMDALYDLLHDSDLAVAGAHVVYCYWEFSQFVPEPDNKTQHGVTRFRIAAQQS